MDVEYAALCGASITPRILESEAKETSSNPCHRNVRVAWPAGLTLTNAPSGKGVTVVKVMRGNGAAVAGIKVGDIIVRVNGTEVRDHNTAVEFIEKRCRVGDCCVEVRTPKSIIQQSGAFLARFGQLAPSRMQSSANSPASTGREGNGEDVEVGSAQPSPSAWAGPERGMPMVA